MSEVILSIGAARALHLAAQGLLRPRRRKAVKADVLEAIRRMALLQIDTINVVARSPYLVLWSQLGDYPPAWLDELLAQGQLFEYWAHEACFIPREDYGLYRHRMREPAAMGWKYSSTWMRERADEVAALLAHIRSHGPVRLELSGFDYRLECYTPAARRRYGYFTLPLLRRGLLVGRVDAKAHRKAGVFEIKAGFFEPGVRAGEALLRDVAQALRRCARWHGCREVRLGRTEPAGLAPGLAAAFAGLAPDSAAATRLPKVG